MKSFFRLSLRLCLNIYAFILCLGSLIWANATAYIFYLISRFIFLIFKTNYYNGFYFIFPFQTFEQWKEYILILKSFIKETSFRETFDILYYKFRNNNQDTDIDLPYFKFPEIKSEKTFYDSQEFPGWEILIKNKQKILSEYLKAKDNVKPYIDEAGNPHFDWNTIMLFGNGQLIESTKSYFPITLDIISNLPDIECSMVMFSILKPGAIIPPHTGPFNSHLRVHLPIILPVETKSCIIKVGIENRNWEEDNLLIFDDSYLHSVSNKTSDVRVILMMSVWKPDIQPHLKNLIEKFISLFNSSPPLKKWMEDNS
ncbi:MAG TPA: aspartyl/asparaginyl beta-hydroxylase domain-containing protein [Chitinophagales bacterium]|nr:aspartyl/asparaginyl beta-hydroxylase domain-containing protein [Chitinophagales bacterium]